MASRIALTTLVTKSAALGRPLLRSLAAALATAEILGRLLRVLLLDPLQRFGAALGDGLDLFVGQRRVRVFAHGSLSQHSTRGILSRVGPARKGLTRRKQAPLHLSPAADRGSSACSGRRRSAFPFPHS